jgi:signal transduction histidine kinase
MKYNSGNIYLNVTNSYNAETIKQLNGRFLSSKGYREGNLLGIGLGNIQNIVDMYGGIFQVELDEKNFNLRIMLSDKKI